MAKNLPLNRVVISAVLIVAFFFVLRVSFSPPDLIILLNGLFVGSLVAIAVAYHKLIWYAALGVGKYDRVRQMTLGFALQWVVISIGVFMSIYIQYAERDPDIYTIAAFARYLAIVAAVLQVTAPDFGLGLFHGRDRKVLYTSFGLGLIVATAVILFQGG